MDKLIETYCDFDDFCLEFIEQWQRLLIENAIRHTPENGQITLIVDTSPDEIKIAVNDTGMGIAENEIAFIFDARYQASNTQKDPNIHAGLGLAICKKLMKIMGSELQVEGTIGEGTTFWFKLSPSL